MKRPQIETPEISVAFGLVAWLEETKIHLPLKGVECRFEVTAGVASVELDQIFHQSHAQPLDCTYTFPLPAGAAVYRCEMHVNGRVIRARIEAAEHARRVFEEAKADGRRAALVETERDNLFTLSLGNLQSGDVIVIRLAYFQVLERIATEQRLRVPVCPGVRYIPGRPLLRANSGGGTADDTDRVPDASRISPPRIDALHPDAAYFSARGTITRGEVAADTLSSPTHPVFVKSGEVQYAVELADQGAFPDRDLVLRWQEPKELAFTPRAWSHTADGESFALVQLRAPADVSEARDFEQDVYFLIDRSGSMGGAKWTKTCEALTSFVKILGATDRVWITLFESGFQDFAEAPLPAARVLGDKNFHKLLNLGVGGGTELLPAARHVLAKIRGYATERPVTMVLITDGQVGNDEELLREFRPFKNLAVHTFGIDVAVNDALLKQLARQQGGDCWLQTPNDDIAATVTGLANRLRRPVLTEIEIRDGWEPADKTPRNLYARQVIDLSLRRNKLQPVKIHGRLATGESYDITLQTAPTRNLALRLLWARERIASLLAEGDREQALALAKQHNLLCEGAAFVAWDEAEQVQIATRVIIQPSLQEVLLYWNRHATNGFPKLSVLACACESDLKAQPSGRPPLSSGDTQYLWREPELGTPTRSMDEIAKAFRGADVDETLAKAFVQWGAAEATQTRKRASDLGVLLENLERPGVDLTDKIRLCREFVLQRLSAIGTAAPLLLALIDKWEERLQGSRA